MQAGFVIAVFAMLAIAAAFVLPALWRGSRRSATAIALMLPIAAVAMYMLVGTPAALDPAHLQAEPTIDQQIDALAQHLRTHPDELDGWVALARSRREQHRYGESEQAYGQALRLSPNDPALMVELAVTMATADPSHRIDDAALKLLHGAQQADPRNQHALWFLGIAAYQRGDYVGAATTWQSLLPLAPPDTRAALRDQIDGARAKAGLPPLPAEAAAPSGPALLTVRVDISPALRAKLAAGDTLFVFARSPNGPPMPLAVKRMPAKELPATITLADGDGPMPTMRLSQQKTVSVLARVSHSGDALPQPGDFEAAPANATVGAKDTIALTIDIVHP